MIAYVQGIGTVIGKTPDHYAVSKMKTHRVSYSETHDSHDITLPSCSVQVSSFPKSHFSFGFYSINIRRFRRFFCSFIFKDQKFSGIEIERACWRLIMFFLLGVKSVSGFLNVDKIYQFFKL